MSWKLLPDKHCRSMCIIVMVVSFSDKDITMETEGVESVVGSIVQTVGVVSGAGGHLDWLKGSFLQSALCQVFQRFALEGDEESRVLVHKVC